MNVLNILRLTPFEWSMSDRVAGAPMEFVVRLDCDGIIDQGNFSKAISAELKRHPLFQANATVGETHRQSRWRPAENCVPKIHWANGNPDLNSGFPDEFLPIDLENEIGIRIYGWCFTQGEQPRVVIKFVYHHSCCDGKGGLSFVEQTLQRYQSLMNEESDSPSCLETIDEQRLLNRNLPTTNKLGIIDRVWSALVVRPKRAGNMLLSKPRLYSEDASALPKSDVYSDPPRQCFTTLTVEQTKQLGHLAKQRSASSNTILARELFHALNDISKSESGNGNKSAQPFGGQENRQLRILVPFSLRDDRHDHMPAANCVSMAYLEATTDILEKDNSDDPKLISDLNRQMNFIRRWNLQYSWIDSLDLYSKIWPLIRIFKSRKRGPNMAPIATTVMTNLGRVFSGCSLLNSQGEIKSGSLVVKSVHVAAPCNASVAINFSVIFYGDRLTLDTTYLPSLVDQKTAEQILGYWKRRIVESTARVTI